MASISPDATGSGVGSTSGATSPCRGSTGAVVSGVVLDRAVVGAGLTAAATSLLFNRGFDVLDVIEVGDDAGRRTWSEGLARPLPSPAMLVVVVDVSPLRDGLVRSQIPPGTVNNHRLRMVPKIESALRQAWSSIARDPSASEPAGRLMSWFESDRDGWPLVRRVVPAREATYREQAAELEAWMVPPLPVVAELSEWGIASRTDVVEHQGALAVCKTFRRGRERAFHNELGCYALADRVEPIPAPLASGRNWVLLPYLGDYDTLDRVHGSRVPVSVARTCIAGYQQISDLGIALLDFGPKNVLVAPDGRIAFIDFEHSFAYPDQQRPSLLETPLARGAAFFEPDRHERGPLQWLTDGIDVLKTYDRHWLPLTGIPLRQVIDVEPRLLRARQLAFFGRRGLTRRVRRLRTRSVLTPPTASG